MPSWVKDEHIWQEAKARIAPHADRYQEPYAAVTAVYKQMGGRIGGWVDSRPEVNVGETASPPPAFESWLTESQREASRTPALDRWAWGGNTHGVVGCESVRIEGDTTNSLLMLGAGFALGYFFARNFSKKTA